MPSFLSSAVESVSNHACFGFVASLRNGSLRDVMMGTSSTGSVLSGNSTIHRNKGLYLFQRDHFSTSDSVNSYNAEVHPDQYEQITF